MGERNGPENPVKNTLRYCIIILIVIIITIIIINIIIIIIIIIIVIIIIIIIISFITVSASVFFVHQLGINQAPGASDTQVIHSDHIFSTFLRIRADPSVLNIWVSVIVALSDTFRMFSTIFIIIIMFPLSGH